MSSLETLVHRYIDSWNQTDAGRRKAAIRELYTADAGYTDPLAAVQGWDGIDGFVAAAQQQFKGLVFSLAGKVDAHHDTARFTWHLGAPGAAEPVVIGFDVVAAQDGRLRQVYGFLDKLPAAA
ncbi:MAG TPA: nuclear transport factor 2 family protein [Nevskia sp.]|nr:nuclear transport factor 2 family protein [Nevskia sp.]